MLAKSELNLWTSKAIVLQYLNLQSVEESAGSTKKNTKSQKNSKAGMNTKQPKMKKSSKNNKASKGQKKGEIENATIQQD